MVLLLLLLDLCGFAANLRSHSLSHTLLLFIAYLRSSFLLLIAVFCCFGDKNPVFYLALSVCDSTQHKLILSNSPFFQSKIPIGNCFLFFVWTPMKSENKRTKIHKKKKRISRTHTLKKMKGNFESEVFQIRFFCRGADGVFLLLFSLACLPACLHNCCFAFFTFSRTQMHSALNVCAGVRAYTCA